MTVGKTKKKGPVQFRWLLEESGSAEFLTGASRKFGNSPQRNRFKRVCREALRKSSLKDIAGLRLAILAREKTGEKELDGYVRLGIKEIETEYAEY